MWKINFHCCNWSLCYSLSSFAELICKISPHSLACKASFEPFASETTTHSLPVNRARKGKEHKREAIKHGLFLLVCIRATT